MPFLVNKNYIINTDNNRVIKININNKGEKFLKININFANILN